MSNSTSLGKVYGIPIRVHITLWILLPIIAMNFAHGLGSNSLLWGLLAAVGLFASVALHELGHSIVAIHKGCRVREILLLPIGGVAQMEHLPSQPNDELQIAIAGPAVSMLLAIVFAGIGHLAHQAGMRSATVILTVLGSINFILALFNLLPSFPMDGGRVFRAWMTPRVGRLEATRRAAKIGRVMAIIFGIIGVFQFNLFLIAIAIFIYFAAGAEYRTVAVQETIGRRFYRPSAPPSPPPQAQQSFQSGDREFTVSPPPYERKKQEHQHPPHSASGTQHGWFEDLYRRWR